MSDTEVRLEYVVDQGDGLKFIKTLFVEYAESLGFSLCFQGFDEELAALPGKYERPDGCLILAYVGSSVAGCIGVRRFDETYSEMKRLYVRPDFRGYALGTHLATEAVKFARSAGYGGMYLDTIGGRMAAAQNVYHRLGFEACEAYYHNPLEGVVFYKLDMP
jgi:GNAT superfamily N-acetyltransferase